MLLLIEPFLLLQWFFMFNYISLLGVMDQSMQLVLIMAFIALFLIGRLRPNPFELPLVAHVAGPPLLGAILLGVVDDVEGLLLANLPAFLYILDHIVPILLLYHAFDPALARTFLVGRQVAETVVLQMEGKLEFLAVVSLYFYKLPLELEFCSAL